MCEVFALKKDGSLSTAVQRVLFGLLQNKKNISDVDFFKLFSAGSQDNSNIKKLITLIMKDPKLATKKHPISGESTLFLVVRNYSADPLELMLIDLLITVEPTVVTLKNPKAQTIMDIIKSFDFEHQHVINQAIMQSLAKFNISSALAASFQKALSTNNYPLVISLFLANPHLVNFVDTKGRTIQYYADKAPNYELFSIMPWVTAFGPK